MPTHGRDNEPRRAPLAILGPAIALIVGGCADPTPSCGGGNLATECGPALVDSGPMDSGSVDGGGVDAGAMDSGSVDAGPMDSGVEVDAASGDAGGAVGDAGITCDGGCDPMASLDWVTGAGTTYSDSGLGYTIGSEVAASSDSGGANPTGQGRVLPGLDYFRVDDEGPVTCLKVAGNRAAFAIYVDHTDLGAPEPYARLVFVEDNGPAGDRIAFGDIALPATTCPVPVEADFAPEVIGGMFEVGPELASGDFTVHDAP